MATAILQRACQVAIETEAAKGTAETLVAADINMRVKDVSVTIAAETYEQDLLSADLSHLQDLVGNLPMEITYTTLIAGSGTVDVAPGWCDVLIHGGFDEVVNAGTSVVYSPETPCSTATATVGVWFGASSGSSGRLFVAKGCRPSSISFNINPGQPVEMTVTWMGAYSSSADASAFSSPTYDATVPQTAKNLGMTIGSWTPLLKSMTINVENTLGRIDNPGASSENSGILNYEITDRKVSGSIAFLEVLASDKDYIADIGGGVLAALTMTVGATSTNKVKFDMPKFQLLPGSQSNFEDLLGVSLSWVASRNSQNDEFVITTL